MAGGSLGDTELSLDNYLAGKLQETKLQGPSDAWPLQHSFSLPPSASQSGLNFPLRIGGRDIQLKSTGAFGFLTAPGDCPGYVCD